MSRLDPVALSVLTSALEGIAEEMGALLIRGAYSSNIKERRDCSAAVFDDRGRMVAQAEHIPVHLGAMPEAVAAVRARSPQPGDVFIVNDPFIGGTHLPDVTLVSPIEAPDGILGYAVTRAHHSDVGGMRPGSLPSDSREIFQEGLIVPPVRLVRAGRTVGDLLEVLLANVRTPDIRRGDLQAQLAANALGGRRMGELCERHGLDVVRAAFDDILSYTERRTRAAIAQLPDGTYEAEDVLEGDGVTDDDILVRAAVTVEGDGLVVDFEGSAGAVAGNVNCTLAVTRSASFFAVRVLLPGDVPANAGVHEAVEVRAPAGSVVNASPPHAVVAGNTETAQRIADTVLAALGRCRPLYAQGQGTMNNVVVGGSRWTYYETIGGGQGAGPEGPGDSGVHVGMSNTLNTPVEALELEYPMRIETQRLVYGSGGEGRFRGGDGVERALRVLEPAHASLLTDRRRRAPRGAAGGRDGAPGENLLNGRRLRAKCDLDLSPGDVVTIRTPGGGGWGEPGRVSP